MTAALAANPTQRYRWVILLIATFAQACACFFVQGIGAIAVFIQNDLQLSSLQIGLLVSAAQLVPIVGLLVAGELLDRYSERLVVGLGTLIVALALCASLWATDYLTILLFLVVVGAGYSTAQPGGSKSVSRWFAKTQLGFAMGIRQAGLPLGGALSAALLPYLAGIYGWRSAFLAGGLVAFLGALAFMLFYRTPPDAPAPGANPAERDLGAVVKSRLAMITDPAMKNIVCSGVALISVQYGILVFTVLYLHETLEIGIGMAATLLFVAQGSGVAGRILLAAWSDRCRAGRYFPVMVCLGAVILGLLALVLLPLQSPLGMGLVVAWLGFFGFGWYGPWVAYVADTAPVGKTGFALGLAMAINQLAIVLAPPALGLLKDWQHLDQLHRQSLEALAGEFGLALDEALLQRITGFWHRLRPWPDTLAGMHALKADYWLAALSNGNTALMLDVARHAGLPWDMLLCADLFGHYKPDPQVYLGACRLLDLPPQEVMLCAAHNYDLKAARALGLKTAFIARPLEYGPGQSQDLAAEQDWDLIASDLLDLHRQLAASA